jgi:hypothetical protein
MRIPKYRCHKARGLAVVRIDGRDNYLGPYDSPDGHEKYHRLIAEWMASGPSLQPDPVEEGPTVNAIVLGFLEAHKNYYARDDGTQTGEMANFVDAVRHLKSLFGRTPARDFSPKKLGSPAESVGA